MARRNERKAQPLGIDGVVVVGFTGQQAVRAHSNGICKQASARTADDRQALDRLTRIHKLHLHRRAVLRLVAARSKLLLCLAGKLRNRDFFNGSHTAAALGKGFHILHVKDACQHFVHAALGSIQIGVHTDGRNARLHQLERHILRADLFERIKNDRVVGHDHLTLLCGGFGHHLGGDVQCCQHPVHLPAAVHQQAGIVPAFGQFQRRDGLHCFVYLPYCYHRSVPSFKIASISAASALPSGTPRRIRGSFAFCQSA